MNQDYKEFLKAAMNALIVYAPKNPGALLRQAHSYATEALKYCAAPQEGSNAPHRAEGTCPESDSVKRA